MKRTAASPPKLADLDAIKRVLASVRTGELTPADGASELCCALRLKTSPFANTERCLKATQAILAEVLATGAADPVALLDALFDRRDQGIAGHAIGRLYLALPQTDRNRITSRSTFA